MWNVDNQACLWIRPFKHQLGYPWRIFFELHGWWHFFTAYCGYGQTIALLFMKLKVMGRKDIEFGHDWLGPTIEKQETKIY